MKKNKEKKPSIGYVAIEVIIIMTIVIIGGIFAISSFFIKGQDNYTEVEKAEDQVYDAVIFNPHNPGGGGGSGNPGGPGGTGGGGSETINYTIVFDGNGGSNSSKKVQKGNKLGSLPSSTYEGYTFIGWFTAKTGGDKITDNYLPDGDKTFYAHWASNDYEVVYHGNGNTGGETKKSSHTYGTEFKLTKNGFVKTGYSFLGWNTKQDGKGKTYSDEQKVKNLTAEKGGIFNLYAQWKINSYSVSFKGNGGTDSATIIKKYNESLGTLPSSNRTGYTFKGWYTSADGGEQVTAATKVPAHDVTYFAHWEVNNYTIKYNLNGGSVSVENPDHYSPETETFTLNNPTKTGYEFKGWTGSNGSTAQTTVSITKGSSGNKEFTANWVANNYTVKYNGNGHTGGTTSDSSHKFGTTSALTANGYTKTGYLFVNWNTKADGSGKSFNDKASVSNLTEEKDGIVTLYAQWKVDAYSITYNLNGGKLETANPSTYNVDTPSFALKNPTRTGYDFAGWSGSNGNTPQTTVTISQGSTGDKTFTANWTPHTYMVRYLGNGSTSGSMNDSSHTFGVEKALSTNKYVKTGYQFKGWNTKEDGSGTAYVNEAKVKDLTSVSNETIMLYAQWEVLQYTYEIIYESASGVQLGIAEMTNEFGKTVTVEPRTITGYTSPSAQEIIWDVAGKKTITFTYTPIKYTITYDLKDGIGGVNNPRTYDIETETFELTNPYKTGYNFTGWTGSNGNTPSKTVKVEKGSYGNKTFIANWLALTDIMYKVEYYTMNTDGSTYTLDLTIAEIGTAGSSITPEVKNYTGFKSPSPQTTTIKGDGSTVVKYYYTRNQYTLTANTGNGIEVVSGSKTYYYGEEVALNASVKDGYKFKEWVSNNTNLLKNSSNNPYKFNMPAGDLALTANADVLTFNITYDLKGGAVETQNPVSYVVTDSFTLNNPTREGYTFTGWTGSNGATPESNVTVNAGTTGDLHYTANWTPNTYNIYYHLYGGTNPADAPTKYKTGDTVYFPTPVREGYGFVGWFEDSEYNLQYEMIQTSFKGGDVHAHAKWTENTYNIEYRANGGQGTMTTKTVKYGTTVNLDENKFSRTGYSFKGWNTKADGSGVSYDNKQAVSNLTAINGETIVLHAQWSPITYAYNVVYVSTTGVQLGTKTIENKFDTINIIAPNEYAGYKTPKEQTVVWDSVAPKTITFKYEPIIYTLSYTLNDGVLTSENHSTYTVESESFTLNNPTKEGYGFTGWTGTNVNTPTVNMTIIKGSTGNKTFTANWTPNTYVIKYNGNGATSGEMENSTHSYGVSGTLNTNKYERTGYTFKGWNTKQDGKGTSYTDGATIKNLATNQGTTIELFAMWQVNSYTYNITHVSTSGKIIGRDTVTATFGATKEVYPNAYVGYEAPAPQTVTWDTTGNKEITFIHDLELYTITYNLNNGIGGLNNPTIYTIETETFELVNPTKPGYIFVGWTGANGNNPSTLVEVEQGSYGNKTFEANWLAEDNTVYRVEHYKMKLDGATYELAFTENLVGETDTEVSPEVRKYTGFTSPAVQTTTIKGDGSTVVKYYYTRNQYTLTVNNSNGISASTGTNKYYYEANVSVSATVKEGYTWDKWSSNATSYVSNSTNNPYEFKMPASDVVLTANAKTIKYTITYDLDGGSVSGNKTEYTVETPTFTLKQPTKEGYTFAGWTGTGLSNATLDVEIKQGTMGNKSYLANWAANDYTIVYYGNGSTSGKTDSSAHKFDQDSTLTPNGFVRTGYTFTGWNTMADGSGQSFNDKATVRNLTSVPGATFALHAQWKINSYTVSFDGNGGSDGEAITNKYGEALGTLPESTRTGYTFLGWYTAKSGGTRITEASTIPAKNTTYYAQWAANEITVTYVNKSTTGILLSTEDVVVEYGTSMTVTPGDINGYKTPAAKNIVVNSTSGMTITFLYEPIYYTINCVYGGGSATNSRSYSIETPTFTLNNPFKTGATFIGWTGSNGDVPMVTVSIVQGSTGDKTFIAHYETNTYQVKYDGNTATGGTMKNSVHTYGVESNLTNNTYEKVGYSFKGWNTEADGSGTAYTNGATVKDLTAFNGAVVTLYAQWDIVSYSYKVVSKSTSGTILEEETKSAKFGTTVTVTPKERTGYTKPTSQTITIDATGTQTVTFKYTPIKYTISYNLNGGIGNGSNPVEYTIETATFTLYNPTKPGYTFHGWTGANGNNPQTNVSVAKGSTGNKTFNANWLTLTDTAYTVEHYTMNIDGSTYKLHSTENLSGETDSNVTPTVKTFNGFTSPEAQTVVINGDGSTVVKYYYTRNQYTLTVKGGVGIANVSGGGTYYYNELVTVDARVEDGYIWTGWASNSGAVNGSSSKEYRFYIPAEDLTLTAMAKSNTYTINYDSNGGTGSMTSTTHNLGESVTLVQNTFSKEGYVFAGWNTEEDGSGTSYTDKEEIVNGLTATGGATVTLYAQWKIPADPYTLVKGEDFRNAIPSETTSIVFTDINSPNGATLTNLSVDGTDGVVGWLDGTTWYVSTRSEGVKIAFNPDSTYMFLAIDESKLEKPNVLPNLENITFNNVDTSKVELANGMFGRNEKIKSLDLSSFNVSNVTMMLGMFAGCTNLESVDLSNFKTSSLIYAQYMFQDCLSLKELDLSAFDMSNIWGNGTLDMFLGMDRLEKVTFGSKWRWYGDNRDEYPEEMNTWLPTPNPDFIKNADGYWYGTNGNRYYPKEIPNGAGTYYAFNMENIVANVVYSTDDGSLSFYNGTTEIIEGETHNGKTATNVYQIMKEDVFTSENLAPWYNDHGTEIKKVEFVDEIKPLSTSHWFYGLVNTESFALEKLNTSNTTDMSFMFYHAGANVDNVSFGSNNNNNVDLGLNEYGFYFGLEYCAEFVENGVTHYLGMKFYEDGSWDLMLDHQKMGSTSEPGEYIYEEGYIWHSGDADPFKVVEGSNGTKLQSLNSDTCMVLYEKPKIPTGNNNSNNSSDKVELNEYGFYFNRAYEVVIPFEDGSYKGTYTFYENGSGLATFAFGAEGETSFMPEGTFTYSKGQIAIGEDIIEVKNPNGTEIGDDEAVMTLVDEKYKPILNEYGFYYYHKYLSYVEEENVYAGISFLEDNTVTLSMVMKQDNVFTINGNIILMDNGDGTFTEINILNNGTELESDGVSMYLYNSNGGKQDPSGLYFGAEYIQRIDETQTVSMKFNQNGSVEATVPVQVSNEGISYEDNKIIWSNENGVSSTVMSFSNEGKTLTEEAYFALGAGTEYEVELPQLSSTLVSLNKFGVYSDIPYKLNLSSYAQSMMNGIKEIKVVFGNDGSMSMYGDEQLVQSVPAEAILYEENAIYFLEDGEKVLFANIKDNGLSINQNGMGLVVDYKAAGMKLKEEPNEYGFYFGHTYNLTVYYNGFVIDDATAILYEDGSGTLKAENFLDENLPAGSFTFDENGMIYLDGEMFGFVFDTNGFVLYTEIGVGTIDLSTILTINNLSNSSSIPPTNELGIYPNKSYSLKLTQEAADLLGATLEEFEVVINDDGSLTMYQNGAALNTIPGSMLSYENNEIKIIDDSENPTLIGYISNDGLSVSVDSLPLFVDYESMGLKLKEEQNKYGFYFDYKYSIKLPENYIDEGQPAMEVDVIFHEDGSMEIYSFGELMETANAGTLSYQKGVIYDNEYNETLAIVLDEKGFALLYGDMLPLGIDLTSLIDTSNSTENAPLDFDTSNVVNMESMFDGCKTMSGISGLSNWNVSKVENMKNMFNDCESLTSLEINNWNTSSLKNAEGMFSGCSKISKLDLSKFDMSNVSSSGNMFNAMTHLEEVSFGENWKWVTTTGRLPEPSNTFIAGADGNWYTYNAITYSPSTIPNGKGTYYAVKPSKIVYAVYSEDDYSLSFYNTYETIEKGQEWYGKIATDVFEVKEKYTEDSAPPHWTAEKYVKAIKKVVVVDEIHPTSTAYWFNGLEECSELDLRNLKTENVVDMESMFNMTGTYAANTNDEIVGATVIGLENFDTTNVKNMSSMFFDSWINNIADIHTWNVSNVKDMSSMFAYGNFAGNMDLSSWNVSSVTNMASMFSAAGVFGGSQLYSLNVNNWDVRNVTDISLIFQSLKVHYLTATNWNLESCTNVGSAFSFINIPYNSEHKVLSLDLSGWKLHDATKVSGYGGMFSSLYTNEDVEELIINVQDWDLGSTTSLEQMFANVGNNVTKSVTLKGLETWDVSNITNMKSAFSDLGRSSESININGVEKWNVSKVTDMWHMFAYVGNNAKNWKLDLSNWNTPSLTEMGGMFNASGIKVLDISGFDNSKVGSNSIWALDGYRLEKITLGENWTWYSNDSSWRLPKPNNKYIDGADGYWYDIQGNAYLPEQIPNGAGTYYSVKQDTTGILINGSAFNGAVPYNAETIIFTNIKAPNGVIKAILSAFNDNSVVGWLDGSTYYVSTQDEDKEIIFNADSSNMFRSLRVKNIIFDNVDTSKVEKTNYIFYGLENVETLDLSNWDATDMFKNNKSNHTNLFNGMINLKTVHLPEGWNWGNDNSYSGIDSTGLLPVPNEFFIDGADGYWYDSLLNAYTPEEVPNGKGTYYAVSSEVEVNPVLVKGETFNMLIPENVNTVEFSNKVAPNGVATINLADDGSDAIVGWVETRTNETTENVLVVSTQEENKEVVFNKDASYMFLNDGENGNTVLTNVDINEHSDTSHVINAKAMFAGFIGTELNLEEFDSSKVINMSQMFYGAKNLITIRVNETWTTNNVIISTDMFNGCVNLRNDVNNVAYDKSKVDGLMANYETGYLTFGTPDDSNMKDVEGLGKVEVSDPNIELEYDPNTGDVGGVIPPENSEPEETPELPEEVLPELIEVNYGNFESKVNFTEGTYEEVTYEETYTRTKFPVSYMNVLWSKWNNVIDSSTGKILETRKGDIVVEDMNKKYSDYIVYTFETDKTSYMNGVVGDPIETWTLADETSTLEDAIYLAAYLNKYDGLSSRHIAKWNGSNYVPVDYDQEIKAITVFTETYTVTKTKTVEVTAPSSTTEYVYIPAGTLKAEKDMTWSEWLTSDYNNLGLTTPLIKTSEFIDVSYDEVINPEVEYGFVKYELSGEWVFNEILVLPSDKITQEITYTATDIEYYDITIGTKYLEYYQGEIAYSKFEGWYWESDMVIDFGSTPQAVSKEFYEWFTANAKQYILSGEWVFNDRDNINLLPDSSNTIYQSINFTSFGTEYNEMSYGEWMWGIHYDAENVYDGLDWMMEEFRTVDFGSTPQTVSKEFYEWFTANAKQYTLSGEWVFNEKIIFPDTVLTQGINYTKPNGITINGDEIRVSQNSIALWNESSIAFVLAQDQGDPDEDIYWSDYANDSVIDFGKTPQAVSKEFYEWFTTNASPFNDVYLTTGTKFKSAIPSTATSVVFTNEKAPTDNTIKVDLSRDGDGSILGWLSGTTWKVSSQQVGTKFVANQDSSRMFDGKEKLTNISFGNNFDTSKVENMSYMFSDVGYATTANITIDVSMFDTSSVTDMSYMFEWAGGSGNFEIVGLDKFDTSKVTTMKRMFAYSGKTSSSWIIGDISKWNLKSLDSMYGMFSYCGEVATNWTLGDLSTKTVTSENGIYTAWDVSKVTNMYGVFSGTGAGTTKYSIKGLNTWNTQSATTMSNMFAATGNGKVTRYELNLSGWNTSSVTDMTSMFATSGKNATYFNIIGIENWNTSSVTNMQEMFISTGAKATGDSPYIDLSKWITTKVANYTNFAANAGRIIAPTW